MPRLGDLAQKLQERDSRAERTKAVERELGLPSGQQPSPALQNPALMKAIFDKLKPQQKGEEQQVLPPVEVTGGF